MPAQRPVIAVVVPFLNEERFLPTFLASIEAQTRLPDRLLLVDDGSTDSSHAIASEFAERHDFATLLVRPPRPPAKDRLATAAELRSFQWAARQLVDYAIVAKVDADLDLPPRHLETIEWAFEEEPRLGVTGSWLSVATADGRLVRESHPTDHVRGPNKFYRRECFEQIAPLDEILGWDGFDEVKARMNGWETRSIEIPGGDPVHLRPTGTHDGVLRAYRRWGECAWGYGAHPAHVVLAGIWRMRRRPVVAGGASYVLGWALSAVRRRPRVEPDVRRFVRREQIGRLRAAVARR